MKYGIGIDIGGTKCAVLLGSCDFCRRQDEPILKRVEFHTREAGGPREVIDRFIRLIDELLQEYRLTPQDLLGIGISCGGPLDQEKGIILNPPNLTGWVNVPIVQILREQYRVPVVLENDANACAVAEWRYGAGKGCSNVLFLTFGTGLGMGMILDGRLYRGANGMAGEVGHIRLAECGPVGFGKMGSFEGFCSGGGIGQLAQMKMLEQLEQGKSPELLRDGKRLDELSAKAVAAAADGGDETAKEIYALSGKYLGKGLAVLIDILNPQVIVIGSIFERSGHLLWPYAKKEIEKESLRASREACRIVPAQLGNAIGDYAALSLVGYHFGGKYAAENE